MRAPGKLLSHQLYGNIFPEKCSFQIDLLALPRLSLEHGSNNRNKCVSCHLPSTCMLPPTTRHWIFKPLARRGIRPWDSLVKRSSWNTCWCHFMFQNMPKKTQRLTADSSCSPKGSLNWVASQRTLNGQDLSPTAFRLEDGRWRASVDEVHMQSIIKS